jgi:hypothetical protein
VSTSSLQQHLSLLDRTRTRTNRKKPKWHKSQYCGLKCASPIFVDGLEMCFTRRSGSRSSGPSSCRKRSEANSCTVHIQSPKRLRYPRGELLVTRLLFRSTYCSERMRHPWNPAASAYNCAFQWALVGAAPVLDVRLRGPLKKIRRRGRKQ